MRIETSRRTNVVRRLVDFPAPTPQSTLCRIWQGPVRDTGYGLRSDGERVHRWVVRTVGADQFGTPWDDALRVLHLCDNPPCFRYDHLMLGTQALNVRHRDQRGRGYRRLTPELLAEIAARHTTQQVKGRRRTGPTIAELAAEYGFTKTYIADKLREYRRAT